MILDRAVEDLKQVGPGGGARLRCRIVRLLIRWLLLHVLLVVLTMTVVVVISVARMSGSRCRAMRRRRVEAVLGVEQALLLLDLLLGNVILIHASLGLLLQRLLVSLWRDGLGPHLVAFPLF